MKINHWCQPVAPPVLRVHRRSPMVVRLWLIAVVLSACGDGVAEPIPDPMASVVTMDTPFQLLPDRQRKAGAALQVGPRAYEALQGHARVRVKGFPLERGKRVDLELERFQVTSPETQIVMGTDQGDRVMPHPEVALFRGRVVNEPDSEVYLGVSSLQTNGFIRLPGREYIIAPGRKRGADGAILEHVIYERFAVGADDPPGAFECQTRTAREPSPPVAPSAVATLGGYSSRVAFVALECDYEYGQSFDNLNEAAVYTIELLGAISSVYERDVQVQFYIPYLRIWSTVNDPYTGSTVGTLLQEFEVYWRANMGSVDRDIAHFLTPKNAGGGLAELDVLCNSTWGYGVSSGIVGVFPRPLENGSLDQWDVHVVSHEMGHQFGSPHTHCYVPPIDNCGQSFDDCWNGIYACQQGTIMSYCKSCPGGLANMDIRLHERVITRIRQSVDPSCLRYGLNPVYVDGANSSGIENGTVLFPFNTVLEAVQIVIPGGMVYISTGSYPESIVVNRPAVLNARGGGVTIGP